MDISVLKKEECCGCSACISICPQNALSFGEDIEGFQYPVVDHNKCIDCGLCLTVCKKKKEYKDSVIGAVAAKNKDRDVLLKSSSGGVSNALCVTITKMKGVIYGVSYDSEQNVIISRAETIEECDKFYGSKYVQAKPLDMIRNVERDLISGKNVLVLATSCYVAGLKAYLSMKHVDCERLYTVDLICHGTPSPKLFREYISLMKKKYKNFDSFAFRTKEKVWGKGSKGFGCTIFLKNGKRMVDTAASRAFLNLFFSNNCLRPYCHHCEFAGINKPADLTIADFWGVDTEHPSFYSPLGVSAVLVHTSKGHELLRKCDELDTIESTIEKISRKQGNLHVPSPKATSRDDFWKYYEQNGIDVTLSKYGEWNIKGSLKHTFIYKMYLRIRYGDK